MINQVSKDGVTIAEAFNLKFGGDDDGIKMCDPSFMLGVQRKTRYDEKEDVYYHELTRSGCITDLYKEFESEMPKKTATTPMPEKTFLSMFTPEGDRREQSDEITAEIKGKGYMHILASLFTKLLAVGEPAPLPSPTGLVIEGSATLALAIREPVIAPVIAVLFGINQPLGVEIEMEVALAALAVAEKLADSAETEEAETRMVDIVRYLLQAQAIGGLDDETRWVRTMMNKLSGLQHERGGVDVASGEGR